jgi:hypothetical protein
VIAEVPVIEKPLPTTESPAELEYVSDIEGSTPLRPGTGRNGRVKDASPALVVEKVTGSVPAEVVSMADAAGDAGGRVGCWGSHASTP